MVCVPLRVEASAITQTDTFFSLPAGFPTCIVICFGIVTLNFKYNLNLLIPDIDIKVSRPQKTVWYMVERYLQGKLLYGWKFIIILAVQFGYHTMNLERVYAHLPQCSQNISEGRNVVLYNTTECFQKKTKQSNNCNHSNNFRKTGVDANFIVSARSQVCLFNKFSWRFNP